MGLFYLSELIYTNFFLVLISNAVNVDKYNSYKQKTLCSPLEYLRV